MSIKNLDNLDDAINSIAGGLKPEILVTTNGTQVYATKGSERVDGVKSGNSFILNPTSLGTWTVFAVNSGVSVSQQMAVNAVKRYSISITVRLLDKITITTKPTKTSYSPGDKLSLTGMKVTATYTDGTTAVVSNYTTSPANGKTLTTSDTSVTVSYTENGRTKTASFSISVTQKYFTITFISYLSYWDIDDWNDRGEYTVSFSGQGVEIIESDYTYIKVPVGSTVTKTATVTATGPKYTDVYISLSSLDPDNPGTIKEVTGAGRASASISFTPTKESTLRTGCGLSKPLNERKRWEFGC